MELQPIYKTEDLKPSYKLRYGWTGWPSTGALPDPPSQQSGFWHELDELWETDGLRRLEAKWTPKLIQLTCSVQPEVSPTLFTSRVKGRLQHALRKIGTPIRFSRKLAFRAIGDNTREDVERYIEKQIDREPFADERFRELMRQFTVVNSDINLSEPTETHSGRYWYNLHLVLVTQRRHRIVDVGRLATVRDMCLRIAQKKGHGLSRLAVAPDHVHMSLRGAIERSPAEIAFAYLNNLAYALGQNAIWQFGYYIGTFSEYDMHAVRRGSDSAAGGE
jgi:REP element-mobilizing transposase RayT